MSLAERLRAQRAARFLSQTDLAEKSGVSKATILRIEGGGYFPHPRTIRALAEALEVQPSELANPEELLNRKGKAAA